MAENDELEATIKANKEKYSNFVRRLNARDNVAWKEVYKKVILAITGKESPLRQILIDFSLDRDEIFTKLYLQMVGRKKSLNNYRFEGDLFVWMRWYASGIIRTYTRKPLVKTIMPWTGEVEKKPLIATVDTQTLESTASAPSSELDDEKESCYEKQEEAFARLFQNNPKGATILLLHKREGLTSKAICGVLGLSQDKSHINHVDNAYRQALEEIQKIIKKL